MIFDGRSHRRKYVVRIGIILAGVTLCGGVYWLNRILDEPQAPTFASRETASSTPPATDKRVVLTFDDGPDPIYTPEVMRILQSEDVPATFFLVGQSIARYPGLTKQLYDAGFEIGNHSYSHSERVHSSRERIRYELLATDKLIEQYTGHRAVFYRPPYLLDIKPTGEEVRLAESEATSSIALSTIGGLGFITVGSHVDSNDWHANGAAAIIDEVVDSVPDGHIILLHDGGGDRSETVAALPYIISTLKANGYTFVSLSDYLGLARTTTMPAAPAPTFAARAEHIFVEGTLVGVNQIVPGLLWTLIFISLLRVVILPPLAAIAGGRQGKRSWKGGVSVLVPARNEADNIEGTLLSIALSTHHPREIIVIDDGSTDETADIVKHVAAALNETILLVSKEHGGKASALNTGLAHATYDIVVTIDADSVMEKSAIATLAAHFNDPDVGAVGGKIYAAPRHNLLSVFQDFEYTVGQNIDKRALHALGAVGIIPGAVGAFRKNDIITAGGYDTDTMVEDQDLTYALHILGKRVHYEPRARAYTEVPSTTRAFVRQRLRWAFGTLQCLWKYRSWLFSFKRPRLGWFLIPFNLVYYAIVPFLWPLIFGLAVAMLILGNWSAVVASVIVFFTLDAVYCLLGLLGTPKKLLLFWCIPFQRTYYRLVFAVVYILCGIRILEGTGTYWIAAKRAGSARQYFEKQRAAETATDAVTGS